MDIDGDGLTDVFLSLVLSGVVKMYTFKVYIDPNAPTVPNAPTDPKAATVTVNEVDVPAEPTNDILTSGPMISHDDATIVMSSSFGLCANFKTLFVFVVLSIHA